MAARPGKNPTAVHFRHPRSRARAAGHLAPRPRARRRRPDPLVVLSLWRDNVCAGTFRLRREEVPGLIAFLADGLDMLERRELAAGLAEAALGSESGSAEVSRHADAG